MFERLLIKKLRIKNIVLLEV